MFDMLSVRALRFRLSGKLWDRVGELTRNWHDGPVPPGMLALACHPGVRQAGLVSVGSEAIRRCRRRRCDAQ